MVNLITFKILNTANFRYKKGQYYPSRSLNLLIAHDVIGLKPSWNKGSMDLSQQKKFVDSKTPAKLYHTRLSAISSTD